MEKLFWTLIALLWAVLMASATFAADVPTAAPGEAVGEAAVSNLTSTALPLVTAVRGPIAEVALRPVIEPGQHGGAEFAGSVVVAALLLRSARRRGIV